MVYSFSLFPVPPANHCQKIFIKRKRFFCHWSASSTAHSSIRAEKNHFFPPLYYQTAQSIIVVKVFNMVYALRHLITPTKSNFFQLEYHCLSLRLSRSVIYLRFYLVVFFYTTIFCTKCSPRFSSTIPNSLRFPCSFTHYTA